MDHWIIHTQPDAKGKPSRRNCKKCLEDKKADAKTHFMCEKCEVPLHTNCFKAFHNMD